MALSYCGQSRQAHTPKLMSFKKPFRADPVVLGPYWRAEEERSRRRKRLRQVGMIALLTVGIFVIGMAITNWNSLRAKLPTYYPSCAWARWAGAAPIERRAPGYRSDLDADDDGTACEPIRSS